MVSAKFLSLSLWTRDLLTTPLPTVLSSTQSSYTLIPLSGFLSSNLVSINFTAYSSSLSLHSTKLSDSLYFLSILCTKTSYYVYWWYILLTFVSGFKVFKLFLTIQMGVPTSCPQLLLVGVDPGWFMRGGGGGVGVCVCVCVCVEGVGYSGQSNYELYVFGQTGLRK